MKEIEIRDEQWDALTEQLLTAHFQYGRQALYPLIESIITNLQTVCEIYRPYPDTCIRLLEQLSLPFSKKDYEEQIIAPMMTFIEEQPAIVILAESLVNLRKFLGDDPSFLNKSFHREIALLPGLNKTEQFEQLCQDLCNSALIEIISIIQPEKTNKYFLKYP